MVIEYYSAEIAKVAADLNSVAIETSFAKAVLDPQFMTSLKRNALTGVVELDMDNVGTFYTPIIASYPQLLMLLRFGVIYSALSQRLQRVTAEEYSTLAVPYRRQLVLLGAFRLEMVDESDQRARIKEWLERDLHHPSSKVDTSSVQGKSRRVDTISSQKAPKAVPIQTSLRKPVMLSYVVVTVSERDGSQASMVTAKGDASKEKIHITQIIQSTPVHQTLSGSDVVEFCQELCDKLARFVSPLNPPELRTLPAIPHPHKSFDLSTGTNQLLAYPVGTALWTFFGSTSEPGGQLSLTESPEFICASLQPKVELDKILYYFSIRHCARDFGGALLHSWCMEVSQLRRPLVPWSNEVWDRASKLVSLCMLSLTSSFSASTDGEYLNGAKAVLAMMKAVFLLATAGWYSELTVGGKAWRACPVEVATETFIKSSSPFELTMTVVPVANESNGSPKRARISVQSTRYSASYNSKDIVTVSWLAPSASASSSQLPTSVQKDVVHSFTPTQICSSSMNSIFETMIQS